jgi:simple sugar transport system permease protein
LRSEVLVGTGISAGVPTSAIKLPLLHRIPILGPQLFTNKPIFFAMLAIVGLTSWILFRTSFGLRIRAVGEHPHAAETLGIDPIRVRYRAVVIGGLVAGLAGAWFSMEAQGGFQDNMTNGTGFIALAALIFGAWRPWTAFAGAMLFGFTRALGSRLQILDVTIGDFSVPSEIWQALPFIVTIIVVAGAVGRAVAPAAIGQPYERPS